MKKVIIFIYVFVLVVFIEILITYAINEIYISKYDKGNYDKGLVKSLFVLNYNERYIPYYNYGNYLYKTGDYKNAVLEYEKALEKNVSNKRVCFVRINLSLALTNTVSEDMSTDKKLEIYEKARKVLYEDNCAQEGEEQGGKNEDAEQLEEEIQEKEKETKEDGSNQGGQDKEDDSDSEKDEKEKEQKKSDELEERNKDANKNRQEGLEEYKDQDNRGNYYSGKKW